MNDRASWEAWWYSGEEFTCQCGSAGSTDLIPGSGRSTGVDNPLAWKILQTEESERLQSMGLCIYNAVRTQNM